MSKCFKKFNFVLILFFLAVTHLFSIGGESTFRLEKINEERVPYQDKIPYPSFEYNDEDVIINLNGDWKVEKISLDHEMSLKSRTKEVIKKLEQESRGRHEVKYNDKNWSTEKIPHVNNLYPSRYQDGMWYRKSISIPKNYENNNLRIFFHGANYTTDVWINGHYVGFHEGGYTPFVFDITDHVKFGQDNVISIRVDNIPWLKSASKDDTTNERDIIPYKTVDWWNYGGITRDVFIKVSEKVHLVRADIKTKIINNDDAEINTKIVINNTSKKKVEFSLRMRVYEAQITEKNILNPSAQSLINNEVDIPNNSIYAIEIEPEKLEVLNISFVMNKIKKWSAENPNLYVMKITLSQGNKILEDYYTQFGIREIKVNNKEISLKLNDQTIFLQGIARHEDYPDQGIALSYSDIKKVYTDLSLIKEANADFLKTSHYPNHPMTYILADRIGLMVMEEIPASWFDADGFNIQRLQRGVARGMWLEMIYRDYNRPSILFWSPCNESGSQSERNKFMLDLKELAYQVDGSRLVGQSAVGADKRDFSHQGADYIGITSYYGVFYENTAYYDTKKALAQLASTLPGMPIIANEFGVWSEIDFRNAKKQVEVLDDTFRAYSESKYSSGLCWWTAFDWYTMNGNPFQTMGLITADRRVYKPVYFEIQRLYGGIPEESMTIISPENNAVVKGEIKIAIKFNAQFNPQVLNYRIEDESYIRVKDNLKNSMTIKIDSLQYGDGEKMITIKAENEDHVVATRQIKIIINNYDDPPVLKIMTAPRFISFMYDVNVIAYDDNEDLKVFYKIDDQEKQILENINKGKKMYRTLSDMSDYNDGSLHQIVITAIDSGQHEVKKEVDFKINRKKQIFVKLPFNLDRISYNTDRGDAFEWSFPAELLPKGNSYEYSADNSGIQFFLGGKEKGEKNILVCKGQTLDVNKGKYKNIHVFGYTYWGNQKNECALEYDDGSTDKVELLLSDWNSAVPTLGDSLAWYCDHHHEHTGIEQGPEIGFYRAILKCDPNKNLVKIQLPNDEHKHLVGITLEHDDVKKAGTN